MRHSIADWRLPSRPPVPVIEECGVLRGRFPTCCVVVASGTAQPDTDVEVAGGRTPPRGRRMPYVGPLRLCLTARLVCFLAYLAVALRRVFGGTPMQARGRVIAIATLHIVAITGTLVGLWFALR